MVFASSDGDGDIVHRLCTALATPAAAVSPTDFHNSVHNAATGYWSIGAHSQAPSTAICAYDGSFSAGLLEAACQIAVEARPVLRLPRRSPSSRARAWRSRSTTRLQTRFP